jgi:hypothetical protein
MLHARTVSSESRSHAKVESDSQRGHWLPQPPTKAPRPTSHNNLDLSKDQVTNVLVHFKLGSLIQLSNGDLKKVEDLTTNDFVQSANQTKDVQLMDSMVAAIDKSQQASMAVITFLVGKQRLKVSVPIYLDKRLKLRSRTFQVSVEADVSHPFFAMGLGWSSIDPGRTLDLYQLPCRALKVGDVCISLSQEVSEDDDLRVMPPPPSSSSTSTIVSSATVAPPTTSNSSSSPKAKVPLPLKLQVKRRYEETLAPSEEDAKVARSSEDGLNAS